MIRRLPEEIIRKIAAGEVVVGAFSVVKELIENSLDAEARRIDVEIRKGGKEYIRITDDGTGMTEEDVLLAIQPHTTSKISSVEDLYEIRTYGFRGEALSSIVRVSRVVITTKKKEEELGTKVTVEGGEVLKVEKVPAKVGTSVVVRDLFFNMPARRKFLKSASIEGRMVTETLQKFILARPDVHFTFERDGKIVYNAPPSDVVTRISMVIPDLSVKDFVKVEGENADLKIFGFVTKVGIWRKTRRDQFVFVNGRYVLASEVSRAVERGYGEALPKNLHPAFVIFLEIPPRLVDVNVHPQKLEVKFSDLERVERLVSSSVRKAVSSNWKRDIKPPEKKKIYELKRETEILREPMELLEAERRTVRAEETPKRSGNWKIIAILRDRYVLAEEEDGILIMDYHAAHERILYEDLIERFEKEGIISSSLLIPIEMRLDEVMREVAIENRETLKKLGFEFEETSVGLKLMAIPGILPAHSAEEAFREILEDLRLSKIAGYGETLKKVIADIACKSAVRTGDRLDIDSASRLFEEVERRGLLSCPHGRPLVFKLSYEDLDKYFERK